MGNVAIDIVGISLYWNDVQNTGTVRGFLEFLELINIDQVVEILPDYSADIFRLPSFLMMIVAARLFVFPVINAWFSIILATIWCEISSSINRKNKEHRRPNTSDEVEEPKIIPVIQEPEIVEIQPSSIRFNNVSDPPPNAAEAMEAAVTLSLQNQNLEPEIEQRPLSGFNDADFVRKLDGIVEQGLKQYQETGLSNVRGTAPELSPEEDPRVWTGLLYPSVPTVMGETSTTGKNDENNR